MTSALPTGHRDEERHREAEEIANRGLAAFEESAAKHYPHELAQQTRDILKVVEEVVADNGNMNKTIIDLVTFIHKLTVNRGLPIPPHVWRHEAELHLKDLLRDSLSYNQLQSVNLWLVKRIPSLKDSPSNQKDFNNAHTHVASALDAINSITTAADDMLKDMREGSALSDKSVNLMKSINDKKDTLIGEVKNSESVLQTALMKWSWCGTGPGK